MAEQNTGAIWSILEAHRNELRLYCYRMLGSSHDTDDVLQEVALRVARAGDGLRDPSNARAWLYRIATNVCLDALRHRRTRHRPFENVAPSNGEPSLAATDGDAWIEPCPDTWIAGVRDEPLANYEARESVTLAFVAALQHLTASQRAALLLRDVVGFSANETAEALGIHVEAATSALFRARAAAGPKLLEAQTTAPHQAMDEARLEDYLRLWRDGDLNAFVALLHDEVKTTMPPASLWIAGKTANVAFYEPMFRGHWSGQLELRRINANGRPAFAFYRASQPGAPRLFRAIHTVEMREDQISLIEHFMQPELSAVFELPREL